MLKVEISIGLALGLRKFFKISKLASIGYKAAI